MLVSWWRWMSEVNSGREEGHMLKNLCKTLCNPTKKWLLQCLWGLPSRSWPPQKISLNIILYFHVSYDLLIHLIIQSSNIYLNWHWDLLLWTYDDFVHISKKDWRILTSNQLKSERILIGVFLDRFVQFWVHLKFFSVKCLKY